MMADSFLSDSPTNAVFTDTTPVDIDMSQVKLEQWVSDVLTKHASISVPEEVALVPLAGDAGFRRYFEVNVQPRLLAVLATQCKGNSESAAYFSQLAAVLRDNGVPTPNIIACDAAQNYLLIEHFGDSVFLDELNADSVDMLYAEALMVLLRLQQVPRSALSGLDIGDYDAGSLRTEMQLFRDWFVQQLLGHGLSDTENQMIDDAFAFLIAQAQAQPQVLVHRDYHSRNLIYRAGEAPGVIDFQDAVWGPVTYDAVSLLRDCYIRWSPQQVERWALSYGNLLAELELIPPISHQQFLQWFDTMGLQRHIKVLGIFARLALRDNKPSYLHDLPLVLRYTLELAARYEQTQALAQWIEEILLPLAQQQPWYVSPLTAGDGT